MHIHRDPQVKQEGNNVTQAAFQSPTAHLVDLCYQRLIFGRHQVNSLFRREEEGAERPAVQRAHLGRTRFPEYSTQQMFEAGMFLQQDMTVAPTGKEYQGMGNQKDFDPYADGIMVHADCYLVTSTAKRDIRSTPASSEAPRSTYNVEPSSADSTTRREKPQHE
jgi:hypothetical protein